MSDIVPTLAISNLKWNIRHRTLWLPMSNVLFNPYVEQRILIIGKRYHLPMCRWGHVILNKGEKDGYYPHDNWLKCFDPSLVGKQFWYYTGNAIDIGDWHLVIHLRT